MSEEQADLTEQQRSSKPVRPALIVSERIVSEYSIFLHHLLLGMADESITTTLICPPACDVTRLVSPGIGLIRHPAYELPLMWAKNKRTLIENLEQFKPTILHCLCESKASLTRWLARHLDLPYVLTVNSLQGRWRRLPVSSRRCAKIIVPARTIATNLTQSYPRFAERIRQVNFGTFVEERSICFSEPGRVPSMVTARSVNNAAEFECLLNAVRHLMIDGYEFLLVMVCDSKRVEKKLRKLLGELGLLQVVIIIPRLEPWRYVLAAGDIFIQPRPSNAFDPLLLEAMSVGAAVAAAKGGVDDLIIEDETAVVFDPDDELSIYRSLQKLLDVREFARKLAASAQHVVRENHSVSGMITSVLETYNDTQQWYSSQRRQKT